MVGLAGRKAVIWVTEDMSLPLWEENGLDIARINFCWRITIQIFSWKSRETSVLGLLRLAPSTLNT